MSGSASASTAVEFDFFHMEKETTVVDAAKPPTQKLFERRRSFRDIQSVISKINPEVLKAVIASSSSATAMSSLREHQQSFVPHPLPLYTPTYMPTTTSGCDNSGGTAPLTICYNGTIAVFEVSPNKAEYILKLVEDDESFKSFHHIHANVAMNFGIAPPNYLVDFKPSKLWVYGSSHLPLARRRSLERFLKKRKERLIMGSPYANGSVKGAGGGRPFQDSSTSGPVVVEY
ncbi:hypothetical protein ACH5RR_035420 [Cinchona calisaya]|uniref:Protein TIFY n=1 Tax=Cinchona calisaya TaxID=153742 RepID=A0ABD2Y1R4_9GENT